MPTSPRSRAGAAALAVIALLALALFAGPGTAGAESAVCTPAGAEDFYSTSQGTVLNVIDAELGVLGNDTTCFVGEAVVSTTTSHGSLSLSADGTFSYTPDAGFSGSDSFVYAYVVEIPARQGVSEQVYTATANIFVSCVDAIADDEYSVPQDTALVVPAPGVTTNDDLCPARGVEVVNPPTHGALNSFATDGSFTYTPTAGFVGTDTYTYRVRFLDDRGTKGRPTAVQILATVTINVTPVVIVTVPPTTTSTTTTTTTTVPETTTTIEEATTTTEAPTTTTTTTAPAAVSAGGTALPRTGSDPAPVVTVGLILVTLGALTLVVRRRRLA